MKKFDATHCHNGHDASIFRKQRASGGYCAACCSESQKAARALVAKPKLTLEERLWASTDKTPGHGPKGDCWEWTASGVPNGYGTMSMNGKKAYVHRISYMLANGPIPNNMLVRHCCDNPKCLNPEHLSIGTHTDNMQDMVAKGRSRSQKKTHCKNGHEFTPENTYIWKNNPRRVCRICASKHY